MTSPVPWPARSQRQYDQVLTSEPSPPAFSDAVLRQRGRATLIASWEAYTQAAPGAEVRRTPGLIAAIFPRGPERAVYNNALLDGGLSAAERSAALETMVAAYGDAGVTHYAAWVHESETALREDLEQRGYTVESSTRAMGMTLADLYDPRSTLERVAE